MQGGRFLYMPVVTFYLFQLEIVMSVSHSCTLLYDEDEIGSSN